MFKNWKSFTTWVMFAASYNYAIYTDKDEPIVYTTGLFTLAMGLVFVFRDEFTKEAITKLIESISTRFKKDA